MYKYEAGFIGAGSMGGALAAAAVKAVGAERVAVVCSTPQSTERAAERIALLEGLSASAEEIAEELAGICKQNGMTMEQLRPYLNADFEATVASNVRMKKAIAFVRDHAVITEKMVEAQEH